MDRYTRLVLTVIAVALCVIAVKPFGPPEAHAGVFSQGPTVGGWAALREIKDPAKLKEAKKQLAYRIPLVTALRPNLDQERH